MTTLGESNTNPGILDELAERLGDLHESARAWLIAFTLVMSLVQQT